MAARSNGTEDRPVSYARVRSVAHKLEVFTPRDLAAELGVTLDHSEEFIMALAWQGLLLSEVDWYENGAGEPEPIYTMEPLPDTIYNREKRAPVCITAVMELWGGFLLYNQRGSPVRLQHKGEKGRVMSTPGARHKQKLRDLAWQRMQEAIHKRVGKEEAKRRGNNSGGPAAMSGSKKAKTRERNRKAGRKRK